jgi:DNA-binding response OmpR family regulator
MDTALIVEDDRDQAQLAAQLVRLRDFEPILAETGESGYELARRLHPDVVLLDLMLPDTSGFEICRRLRSHRETLLTPIVMLTALSDARNRTLGYRVGANAYVTKPYGANDLYQGIEAARAWRARLETEHMKGELHVELNSETIFLQEVNDFLTSLFMSTPLSADQVMQLRQAVMEMGLNAIEWGNQHRIEDLVRIVYRIYADRVEIVIRDQGQGFDRSNLPHAAQAEDPVAHLDVREKLGLREGGFGLLISRGMVDELRYNDPGNEVTLIKRFDPDGRIEGAS